HAIPPAGRIEVSVDAGFGFAGSSVTGLDGATVSVSTVSGRKIVAISVTKTVQAGQAVHLELGGVTNPAAGPQSADVQTKSSDGTVLDVRTGLTFDITSDATLTPTTTPTATVTPTATPNLTATAQAAVPVISDVVPGYGPTTGNTDVSILGSGFVTGAQVFF